ncbi:hydroxyproline-rich glycoprotein [Striga asiatica]|uniref:Hydroxyproline-rich glycoprotein n=1 Tax=Striga asiatica TaxID=4170 RepID=A0A5A7P0M1_STRAF|nr:hydroxyproline-rich glycoprotein [Striga asiatica]
MASGSSGRASHSGSKAFDFGSDDILCSYEDYGNPDGSNGIHTDPSSIANSAKEFNKSRVARSSAFTAASYSTPEESSFNEGVILTVENTMKKYTDNIMRFLEGISSRLSQLELYCYNLDKSIGEMRSDLSRDHGESDSKLKSLEKHVHEVHRSVQILRDKQELADTQKELAKLQLAHKESLSSGQQQNEAKKGNENPSPDEQQLALALPHHQAAPPQQQQQQQSSSIPHHQAAAQPQQQQSSSMPPQTVAYYMAPPQMTAPNNNNNMTAPSQQYPPQNLTEPLPQQQQVPPPPPYQQQWASTPQPQPQMGVYTTPYVIPPHQPPEMGMGPTNSSIPMQRPSAAYVGPPPPQDYGYGRPTSPMPPPQHLNKTSAAPAYGQPQSFHHLPHFQHQNAPNMGYRGVGHQYNELIEKLVGMGYRADHVVSIIQRLDETGQTIDFNSVLDVLNSHMKGSGGAPQRGWRP